MSHAMEMFWVGRVTRRRHNGDRLTFPFRFRGNTITLAAPNMAYGRCTGNSSAFLTHIPTEVYVVWRNGKCLDALVRWRCGASSRFFQLIEEPNSTMCVVCAMERPPRMVSAQ